MQALALTIARVQYMADGHILMLPREESNAAFDDISQGEVFDSLNFYLYFSVVSIFN